MDSLLLRRRILQAASGGEPVADNILTFTAEEANSTIKLNKNGSFTSANLEYSTNGGKSWNTLVVGSTIITLAKIGDRVKIRGNNSYLGSTSSKYHYFTMTGRIAASGDITSLLNEVGGQNTTQIPSCCFYKLFRDCTALTSAPNVPLVTLGTYCCSYMFAGCTNMITPPPILPALNLQSYCYQCMFQDCSSMTTAPELPSEDIKDYCYSTMFNGCASLTQAPSLPATTLAPSCYYSMFRYCTHLTTAPELPATTLAEGCYSYMFGNCTSLVNTPVLPATNLADRCYNNMFAGCTSLTTAPELPATTLGDHCYNQMFYGCTNLNYIKAMFTTAPSTSSTYNWVSGVAATGTFVKNSAATWNVTGADGVPSGWTVQTASE